MEPPPGEGPALTGTHLPHHTWSARQICTKKICWKNSAKSTVRKSTEKIPSCTKNSCPENKNSTKKIRHWASWTMPLTLLALALRQRCSMYHKWNDDVMKWLNDEDVEQRASGGHQAVRTHWAVTEYWKTSLHIGSRKFITEPRHWLTHFSPILSWDSQVPFGPGNTVPIPHWTCE